MHNLPAAAPVLPVQVHLFQLRADQLAQRFLQALTENVRQPFHGPPSRAAARNTLNGFVHPAAAKAGNAAHDFLCRALRRARKQAVHQRRVLVRAIGPRLGRRVSCGGGHDIRQPQRAARHSIHADAWQHIPNARRNVAAHLPQARGPVFFIQPLRILRRFAAAQAVGGNGKLLRHGFVRRLRVLGILRMLPTEHRRPKVLHVPQVHARVRHIAVGKLRVHLCAGVVQNIVVGSLHACRCAAQGLFGNVCRLGFSRVNTRFRRFPVQNISCPLPDLLPDNRRWVHAELLKLLRGSLLCLSLPFLLRHRHQNRAAAFHGGPALFLRSCFRCTDRYTF